MKENQKIEKIDLNRLRVLFLIFAGFIGLVYSYVSRYSMTSDGVSYIDMAAHFLQTDYKALINGIWSPLYPLFISIGFHLIKPDGYSEFQVVHLVNFVIYLLALFSFDFLISSLLKYRKQMIHAEDYKFAFISDEGIISIGYPLFILSSLNIMGMWGADPDICLSIFVYLAMGMLLKIATGKSSTLYFIILGLVLGLGYLAKAPMFPLALLFAVLCYLSNKSVKNILVKVCLSLFVFALVISPYVFMLSKYKGHFTVGESGKLNYAWYVNNVPLFVNFQGDKNTQLKHPTKKIFDNPPIYEFAEPLFGTYPPWTDPTYWYEGVNVHFDFIRQISAISFSLQIYYDVFFKLLGSLLTGIFILFLIAEKKDFMSYSVLIIPALFVVIMFSLVHVEPRYIGAFIPPLFLGLLASFSFSKELEITVEKITSIILLMLIFTLGVVDGREISSWIKSSNQHIEWNTVKALKELGINEGDKVGTIGYSIPYSPYWARLAKVKIVAEVMEKDSNKFFELNAEKRKDVFNTFKDAGVKAIVINKLPPGSSRENLSELPNNLYVYLFASK